MRNLNVYLAAAVAIALSGPAALAQTTAGTVRTAPAGTTTTTTNNSDSANSTTPSSSTTPTPGVTAESSTSGSFPPVQSAGGTGSAMGTNQTTVDPATTRPGSFEPGGAFGPADTTAQGTTAAPATLNGRTGAVLIPGDAGFPGNPSQQNIVIQQQPAPQPEVRTFSTPLLDQTTRDAQSRETRRRNAKQEPRIIGIAPNTDRDLTNQMPDDRIIRY